MIRKDGVEKLKIQLMIRLYPARKAIPKMMRQIGNRKSSESMFLFAVYRLRRSESNYE